ncbi:CDK5RAP1-like protein [Diabrotica virgifera virgifera]|uniref:CDK5RAP1-like protein n=1 Tax=Diabrotica virgifera virgifera TaxID=50390 RepID=A0ABM5KC78_DIAVI|nr:CDK5RAP1-like protein [Diabrotica virgifera virgifera]
MQFTNKITNFYRYSLRNTNQLFLIRRCSVQKADVLPSNSTSESFTKKLTKGPNFTYFLQNGQLKPSTAPIVSEEIVPYVQNVPQQKRKVYFDIYGCQMNVNDVEIVWAILQNNFERTLNIVDADVILIMTCAIRDSAEEKIWGRLRYYRGIKSTRKKDRPSLKVGILGCMAERLKEKVLEKESLVDLVAGPDSYRHLPRLLTLTDNNQKSVNVLLSLEETYADITPVRLNENSISAFVSIMRGCDNMCTYCIVPFTRGRERSRPISSIICEIEHLSNQGVKEVTLLGQNVNSYRDTSIDNKIDNVTSLATGFKTVYRPKKGGLRFADLLKEVAKVNPEMRIRFTSPHPKDFSDDVIDMIKSHHNICKNLHMPAQSGSSAVLERMRRGYTREAYIDLIKHIRQFIPDVALSSDFICGFCGETDEEFDETISLMNEIKYNTAFLFPYSMREKTTAHRRFQDDIADEVKYSRLERMIEVFRQTALQLNQSQIGKTHLVLIEGYSKRSDKFFQGRNDNNIRVILPVTPVPSKESETLTELGAGDYVAVHVNDANSQTLRAVPLYKTSLSDYYLRDQFSSVNKVC